MVDMGMGKRTHGEPSRHAAATALEAAASRVVHVARTHTEETQKICRKEMCTIDATRDPGSMDRAANRERRTSSNPVQRRGSACGLPQELGPARRVTCGRIESRVRIYRVGCEATRVGWNVLLTLPEWAGRRQLGPGRPRWAVRRRGLRVGFVPRRSARPPSRCVHAHSHAHCPCPCPWPMVHGPCPCPCPWRVGEGHVVCLPSKLGTGLPSPNVGSGATMAKKSTARHASGPSTAAGPTIRVKV